MNNNKRLGPKNQHGLAPADETFAALVASGRTQAEALAIAHPHTAQWKLTTRHSKASVLAGLPTVRARIESLMQLAAKQNEVTIERVQQEMSALSFADARELFELRRIACRYCWGKGHRYQRTPAERERALREHGAAEAQNRRRKVPFDEQGGIGYNPHRGPCPECPECHGDGEVQTLFKDTRHLTGAAARLFAGLKTTERGLEIKVRDQDASLDRLARMVGAYREDNEQSRNAIAIVNRIELVPLMPAGRTRRSGSED